MKKENMRSFKLISSAFGVPSTTTRYESRVPASAARKAARVLFENNASKGNTVRLRIRETTRGSKGSEFSYEATKKHVDKKKTFDGKTFVVKHEVTVKSTDDASTSMGRRQTAVTKRGGGDVNYDAIKEVLKKHKDILKPPMYKEFYVTVGDSLFHFWFLHEEELLNKDGEYAYMNYILYVGRKVHDKDHLPDVYTNSEAPDVGIVHDYCRTQKPSKQDLMNDDVYAIVSDHVDHVYAADPDTLDSIETEFCFVGGHTELMDFIRKNQVDSSNINELKKYVPQI